MKRGLPLTISKVIISIIFAVLAFQLIAASPTKVYVWRDANGIVKYSDTPHPDAKEVLISDSSFAISTIDTSILNIQEKAKDKTFEVKITQPSDQETIRDNSGSVYVSGLIKPIFKQGFKITLSLDGIPYGKPQTHSAFILKNIERGEHQLKMHIIDDKGKVIALSDSITFYMHRASVIKH